MLLTMQSPQTDQPLDSTVAVGRGHFHRISHKSLYGPSTRRNIDSASSSTSSLIVPSGTYILLLHSCSGSFLHPCSYFVTTASVTLTARDANRMQLARRVSWRLGQIDVYSRYCTFAILSYFAFLLLFCSFSSWETGESGMGPALPVLFFGS